MFGHATNQLKGRFGLFWLLMYLCFNYDFVCIQGKILQGERNYKLDMIAMIIKDVINENLADL